MVCSSVDSGDVRGRSMKLTEKGDELHDRVILVALERETRLLTGFTPLERAQLLSFVTRLDENMPLVQDEENRGA